MKHSLDVTKLATMLVAAMLGLGSASGSLGAQAARHSDHAPAATQLREAVRVAEHGDPAGALALTRQLLVKFPAYGPALKFEGALYEDAGHPAEAETFYEQALMLAPKDPELLFKIGLSRLVAGDSEQAVSLLRRASIAAPRDRDTLYYLAQAYHMHGDSDAALEAIAKAVRLDPRNATILQKYGELLSSAGDNMEATKWLTKGQTLDPTLDRLNLDLGVASLRNEDLEAAGTYAGKAVTDHPTDVKALDLLAEVDVKLAHWQEAKDTFARLLAINPDDATALLGLGQSDLGLKDYTASVEALQRVLQRTPTTILAHFYLSRAYAGLGQKAESAHETELHNKLVEQAASVVPSDEREVEKATLMEARKLLTEGHEVLALQLFRERSKGPTATAGSPYMLVGVSYLYMGRSQDADRCLKQAIAIEPSVRLAHTYLGLLALQRPDLAEAERQFAIELAQDPNSQLAVAELGEVRYRQGRWAEAAEQLARSRTVEPALLYLLSDAYFHLNRIPEADLTAELAADYGKDDPENIQRITDLLDRNQQTDLARRLSGKQ